MAIIWLTEDRLSGSEAFALKLQATPGVKKVLSGVVGPNQEQGTDPKITRLSKERIQAIYYEGESKHSFQVDCESVFSSSQVVSNLLETLGLPALEVSPGGDDDDQNDAVTNADIEGEDVDTEESDEEDDDTHDQPEEETKMKVMLSPAEYKGYQFLLSQDKTGKAKNFDLEGLTTPDMLAQDKVIGNAKSVGTVLIGLQTKKLVGKGRHQEGTRRKIYTIYRKPCAQNPAGTRAAKSTADKPSKTGKVKKATGRINRPVSAKNKKSKPKKIAVVREKAPSATSGNQPFTITERLDAITLSVAELAEYGLEVTYANGKIIVTGGNLDAIEDHIQALETLGLDVILDKGQVRVEAVSKRR